MLIDQLYVFSGEMSIQSFTHFLNHVICLLLSCRNSLYILDINSLSDTWCANNFYTPWIVFNSVTSVLWCTKLFCFCFCFTYICLFGSIKSLCPTAYGISVPRLGIRTYIPCIARGFLTSGSPEKSPKVFDFDIVQLIYVLLVAFGIML